LTLPIISEYKIRTYEELSNEFKEKASRVFELVPLMYNRLTLVDQMSHKQALKKIINDHGHIRGFSFRNISRNLPHDNSIIPHRVKPKWHKSILTNNPTTKLSATELQADTNNRQPQKGEENQSIDCHKLVTQNQELKEVIRRNTAMITADKIRSIELSFKIPREKYQVLQNVINENKNFMRVTFDETGVLQRVESDDIESRT